MGIKDLEHATPEGIRQWFGESGEDGRWSKAGPDERQKALSILELNTITDSDIKDAKPLPSPDDVRKRFLEGTS